MIARCEALLQISEDQLLSRCREGDVDAFECLYAQYRTPVYRHAYYLLGNKEDARDVRQDTFVKAFQSFASFRADCRLKTWLLVICTNLCRDRIRSRKRRPETHYLFMAEIEPHLDEAKTDPLAIVDQTNTADLIRSVLDALPATHRE